MGKNNWYPKVVKRYINGGIGYPCPVCDMTGEVKDKKTNQQRPCAACKGSGRVN